MGAEAWMEYVEIPILNLTENSRVFVSICPLPLGGTLRGWGGGVSDPPIYLHFGGWSGGGGVRNSALVVAVRYGTDAVRCGMVRC
jgi:hypothetical protein